MQEDLPFPKTKNKGIFVKKTLWAFCLILFACTACARNTKPMMNLEAFEEANVGMSEENLVKTYGEPLNKYYHDNGVAVYEYIERFNMGPAENRVVEARRYYFYIRDGKVISKQMSIKNQPAYEPMNSVNP